MSNLKKDFKFKQFTLFIIAVVLFNVCIYSSIDTYSFLRSVFNKSIGVQAADLDDIISFMGLSVRTDDIKYNLIDDADSDENESKVIVENPTHIILQRAMSDGEKDIQPIIYFDISGDAANYISYINSVELTDDVMRAIPINIKISLDQFKYLNELQSESINEITGFITYKYLNGYINEVREFKFSISYLLDNARDIKQLDDDYKNAKIEISNLNDQLDIKKIELENKGKIIDSLGQENSELSKINKEKSVIINDLYKKIEDSEVVIDKKDEEKTIETPTEPPKEELKTPIEAPIEKSKTP